MEFFNNIIKGLEVILVLYFSLTLNVPLSQSGEVKYYSITVRISQSITGNVSIYPFVNTNLPNYSDYTRRYSVSGGVAVIEWNSNIGGVECNIPNDRTTTTIVRPGSNICFRYYYNNSWSTYSRELTLKLENQSFTI